MASIERTAYPRLRRAVSATSRAERQGMLWSPGVRQSWVFLDSRGGACNECGCHGVQPPNTAFSFRCFREPRVS
jgi:hypothetical protein